MSILSALKARGAKGKNIEEAVKTLPIGGGSGGELETIKIATWSGGGGQLTQFYGFAGTGYMQGGTQQNPVSLYDLIGDKKILDFIFVGYTSTDARVDGCFGSVRVGEAPAKDPRFFTVEERKTIIGGNVNAIAERQCAKMEVYAVCQ